MTMVTYKIRVNRPCRLFIDDEEIAILEELKLAKFDLPEGEYLRKVVAIDNNDIFDELEIVLVGASKLDTITLDTTGLEEAKRNALPKEEFQVGDLMYKALENGGGVTVVKYANKNLEEFVIPNEFVYSGYTYQVREISGRAFQGSNLKSVFIPSNIIKIGEIVFCSCPQLERINVDKGNKVYDSRNNCNAIIETATNDLIRGCKNTIIPNGILTIHRHAFCGSKELNTILLPNSIKTIEEQAFKMCESLTSIIIPNGVTSIEEKTFSFCSSLTSVSIPSSVTNIGKEAFYRCISLTSITIPDSVTNIDSKAFYLCRSLVSITIPNSVKDIGDMVFFQCTSLKSITLSNRLINIGEMSFAGCKDLTSISIPSSVTNIGTQAFSGCSSLTSIIVDKDNKTYDSRNNCNAIIETATNTLICGCQCTIIPNNVQGIGVRAFNSCSGLSSISIPEGVKDIGSGAFSSCRSLTSIEIPNSVISIGDRAFFKCLALTSIIVDKDNKVYDSRNNCNAIIETATNTLIRGCQCTIIPDGITGIGPHAFLDCVDLTSIRIPESVKKIGDGAFSDCSNLTLITIPKNVTSIGTYAFSSCRSLTSISIPEGVKDIGSGAFSWCSNLTSISIPSSVTNIGTQAFSGCSSLTSIIVDKDNKTYDSRNNCNAIIETATNTLICGCQCTIIPNNVQGIGVRAFNSCSGLSSISIPEGVKDIGSGAFSSCRSLTSIEIPNSVISIGDCAFLGCDSLKSITLPKSIKLKNIDIPNHTIIYRHQN